MASVELKAAFARCRTLGHAWDSDIELPYQRNAVFGRAGARGNRMSLRCIHCGTIAFDYFSPITGQRLAPRQYIHPDGYKYEIDNLPTRDDFRRLYFNAQIAGRSSVKIPDKKKVERVEVQKKTTASRSRSKTAKARKAA